VRVNTGTWREFLEYLLSRAALPRSRLHRYTKTLQASSPLANHVYGYDMSCLIVMTRHFIDLSYQCAKHRSRSMKPIAIQ